MMNDDLIERLHAACKGAPVTIPWPHRLLHEAIAEIRDLREALEALGYPPEMNARAALTQETKP